MSASSGDYGTDHHVTFFSYHADVDVSVVEVGTEEGSFSYVVPEENFDDVQSEEARRLLEGSSDPFDYGKEEWAHISRELDRVSEGSLREDETLEECKDRILSPYQGSIQYFSQETDTDSTEIQLGIGQAELRYEIPESKVQELDDPASDVLTGERSLQNLDADELGEFLDALDRVSQ